MPDGTEIPGSLSPNSELPPHSPEEYRTVAKVCAATHSPTLGERDGVLATVSTGTLGASLIAVDQKNGPGGTIRSTADKELEATFDDGVLRPVAARDPAALAGLIAHLGERAALATYLNTCADHQLTTLLQDLHEMCTISMTEDKGASLPRLVPYGKYSSWNMADLCKALRVDCNHVGPPAKVGPTGPVAKETVLSSKSTVDDTWPYSTETSRHVLPPQVAACLEDSRHPPIRMRALLDGSTVVGTPVVRLSEVEGETILELRMFTKKASGPTGRVDLVLLGRDAPLGSLCDGHLSSVLVHAVDLQSKALLLSY